MELSFIVFILVKLIDPSHLGQVHHTRSSQLTVVTGPSNLSFKAWSSSESVPALAEL